MSDVVKQIENTGIVPVVKIDNAKDAIPLAQALTDGGIPVAEITFRTDAAEESIKQISSSIPDILVGAGTILTTEQAESAIKAGAKFIVTPGFSKSVVKLCIEQKIPVNPGVATPTEIMMALDLGIDVVKFFPASIFGGLKALKSMSAPFTKVKFIPTGGINADNLVEYIMFPKVFAVGGSWMVKADLIKEGQFAEITKLAHEAIDTMLGFELGHIGINTANAETSLEIAKKISSVFSMTLKQGNSSNFAGKGIEINKSKGLGANGHIAIATNTITRAIAFLERKGVAVDMSTAKKNASGDLVAVYLKDELGGFAVHLLQKK